MKKYASSFFQQQKVNMFKKLRGEELMCWHRKLFKNLHGFVDPNLKDLAVAAAKLAWEFLGESGSKKKKKGQTEETSPVDLANDFLGIGLGCESIRDELYCILARLVIGNPTRFSQIRGWQLLFLVCKTFAPLGETLRDPFMSLLSKYANCADPDVAKIASLCFCNLVYVLEHGERYAVPRREEIEQCLLLPVWFPVFSVTLREHMLWQKWYLQVDEDLPRVLVLLGKTLKNRGGMTSDGIFRIPGEQKNVQALRRQCQHGNFDAIEEESNPHTLASVFKLWLRELAEPVIPISMYEDCLAVCSDPQKCVDLCQELPETNRRVLFFVCKFLRGFTDPEVVARTQMTVDNLAIVFCPNLLRCTSDDPTVVMRNANREFKYVKELILAADFLR